MMPREINDDQPRPDSAHREVAVDDEVGKGRAPTYAPVTWLILGFGLALTVLLAKYGIWFLFLPIVIPFGLGGRSLFGKRPTRRRVRLDGSVLSFLQEGVAGSSRLGSMDVSGGVFVSVAPSGSRWHGGTESVVRIVSDGGALEVLVSDVVRARHFKLRVVEMLGEGSIRLLERTTALQGGIDVRTHAKGEQLEWERRRSRPWSGRDRTELRLDTDGWALRVYSGSRLESSTGGPGRPRARLATNERVDVAESGVVEHETVLELLWEGEVTARIGVELSEPELRFIASRIGGSQPVPELAR